MSRPGFVWQKASTEFVLALGAGVEALQLVFYAIVDALVITTLEMQVLIIMIATPDPAIQVTVAAEENRAGYDLIIVPGQYYQHALAHVFAQVFEKSTIQGGCAVFPVVDTLIKVMNFIPVRIA